jgi:hypothetical protein
MWMSRFGCVAVAVTERERERERERESPTTLASAYTCTWAALIITTSAMQARRTWARRCRLTRRLRSCGEAGCGCGCECYPVLTLAHGQPLGEQHRRCRRTGPGCGAAGQYDADDAGVRLGCGCDVMRRCGCAAVAVAEREPHDLGQCSHLHMGSLGGNNIGAAGARNLGAALQVNTTLMTLE